jgi:hypothetical protein
VGVETAQWRRYVGAVELVLDPAVELLPDPSVELVLDPSEGRV